MKNRVIIAIVAIAAIILSAWFYRTHRAESNANDTPVVWVKAEKVVMSTLPLTIHSIANVVASKQSQLSAELAGHVKAVLFQDGAEVKTGDLLIQLEDAAYQAKLQAAKAASLLAAHSLQRMKTLAATGAVSKQALDQAEADDQEKKANTDEANAVLAQTKIFASFSGRIGKSAVQPGDYIQVGQPLVTLTDVTHLRVEYHVPEKYLSDLKLNQAVNVRLDAAKVKTMEARVAYISPYIDPTDRTVLVYAVLDNREGWFTPGMLVTVDQSIGAEKEAIFVPARSLVAVVNGEQIYKIMDGKAYAVDIKTGVRTADTIQVTSGLLKDDVIVTDGQQKLSNGATVKVSA